MKVVGPNAKIENNELVSTYSYDHTEVEVKEGKYICTPKKIEYQFKTDAKVPKLGIMLVGWGGNNGTTVTAGILANKEKMTWNDKKGEKSSNWYGSITQASTVKIGCEKTSEVYVPMNELLPLVNPNDVVIGGWDISSMNLADGMKRAQVLDYDLQQKLSEKMKKMKPLPSVYYKDYLADNQELRADNILPGQDKKTHLEKIRKDIRNFKKENECDKIIVLWTASTERFCKVSEGVHDTAENVLAAIEKNHQEISPSSVFATATILEGCSYINGSPQNTLVPGIQELAKKFGVFVCGDDFKSGQTKIKTSLVDFLVSAGIKPAAIVSYNHLGNNDGCNLSEDKTFQSKKSSKKGCVDDILDSNKVLYPEGAKIDHEIVIKYVPQTGDTKKALDEYCSEIFMGGQHTLSLYNVCEDSLLAAPIILDLILITEIFERIQYKTPNSKDFQRFDNVLTTLGYLCKAPLATKDCPMVNSLSRQKNALDNIFKACAGLPSDSNMLLEFRAPEISN